MCVVILSNNNIPNDRYKKVLDTIAQQEYKNFHMVFIDDVSSDDTYEQTIKYTKEIGLFNRTDFIKNTERKFATFNLRNAAYNYCKPKDVFVIVDGDD